MIPKVGVGVYIIKDNKVLMGKRLGKHMSDCWCPPGGHLEYGETPEACAIREVAEETGITIKNLRRSIFTHDMFLEEEKHFITLAIIADYAGGSIQNLEPEKHADWTWFSWDRLPEPLALPVANAIKIGFSPLKEDEKKIINLKD